ncbi:MAG: Gfo/Idh/MocA family oxidoreductase, partial [Terriglobia bacterium]
MSRKRTRIAVVGAGEHGRNHARQYATLPDAELAGIYDIRLDRARAVAQELGVCALESLEEVWNAAEAVSIVIPASGHAAVASEAFRRGIDVLVEKPITRTAEEADGLIREAEAGGRILQVGHVERFNPGVAAARDITRRPLFFEVHRLGVFSPRSLDVDVVYDLMIHDLDLV